MTITPVSSTSAGVLQANSQGSFQQAFGQLSNALQSGNLTAAQSAYAQLTQGGGVNPNSPIGQALSQIGNDLQSGDVGKAQQDLASLQQQLQSFKGAHHRHHHQAADPSQSATATTSASSTAAASPTSTSLVDVTA
jgi:hypothetical protein